ncbi:MAG: NAD(P)H-dependent oxidoreductase subunit E [Campylobacterales bacterium]|nr:NAD(P)H-dependent oxidoreductase subunit E [Campylobacterales bacterium]
MEFPQPAFYIFKCEQQNPPQMPKPSCVNGQTQQLFNYMAGKLMEKGIMQTVTPIRTSCLGRCQMGPVMMVEPGHHMYVGMNEEKIDRVIEEHILGGKPVEEYLIPKEFWAEPISPEKAKELSGM